MLLYINVNYMARARVTAPVGPNAVQVEVFSTELTMHCLDLHYIYKFDKEIEKE